MKEASGELSMTLIVIVAAGAVLAIFLAFRKPIFDQINKMWNKFDKQQDTAITDNKWKTGWIIVK